MGICVICKDVEGTQSFIPGNSEIKCCPTCFFTIKCS